MKVKDVMRTDVVTATPVMSLKEAAATLVAHRISGLPVCEEGGALVGVLSEADILYKERGPSDRQGVLAWLLQTEAPAEAAKVNARTVAEAMTSPAITIAPHRSATAAARLMVDNGINRLPVVAADGTLVGIVTRADLVRAFTRPDDQIATEIREEVLRRALWLDPVTVEVTVADGEVTLAGEVESATIADVLERLVERTPGVVGVTSTVRARGEGAASAVTG